MISKIKRSLELVQVIKAQLVCALRACNADEGKEKDRYMDMANHTAEQLRREVRRSS